MLIAVTLDKLSLAWANKPINYFANQNFIQRHKYSLFMLATLVVGSLLAYIGTFVFKEGNNYFYLIHHNKGITTENLWQSGVDWMVENWYQGLKVFNVD